MSLLIAAAFIGGFLRGLFGFSSHSERKVFLGFVLVATIAEGIIGAIFGLGLLYLNWIHVFYFPSQLIVMGLAGYVGADIINSLYKIFYKRRLEF